jgi:hypothetical protein
MTLTEYLNQEDPQRNPSVSLQEGEYKLGTPYKLGVEVRTPIHIIDKQFLKQFGSIEYVLIGCRLYTTDKHGNEKSVSVFRLPLIYRSIQLN